MIVFDLECRNGGHRFEGWFGSSSDYADQFDRGLIACPHCGSADIGKALMAPKLARKGNQVEAMPSKRPTQSLSAGRPLSPEAVQAMRVLAAMQAEAVKHSRWVGANFAEDARAMHYGEREVESIHGQATIEEAKELFEEGVEIAPLPFPVTPPEQAN
jgi:hypothetical protein